MGIQLCPICDRIMIESEDDVFICESHGYFEVN